MPRFAANISLMFTEIDFVDRFAAAAKAGFRAVEYLFPYDHPASLLAAKLAEARLEQVLFNLPPGDWSGGERGLAAIPGRETEFREGLGQALEYAKATGCRRLHALAGIIPADADMESCERTYRSNLDFACTEAQAQDVAICIEPINRRDIPGYFLRNIAHALQVIADLKRPNLKLQFDVYHVQVTEGDVCTRLKDAFPQIGHIQIANPPGRHQPGHGELDYAYIFNELDRLGYDGWVGCEYRPSGETSASLGWAKTYGIG